MNIGTIVIYFVALLASAIILIVGGWWVTVRVVSAFGRRLKFHHFVGVRHLRGRVLGILAIAAVCLSSCTITTVLSVMGGFSNDLKQKILSTNAHVVVDNYGRDLGGLPADPKGEGEAFDSWKDLLQTVRKVDGVRAATPMVQGEAMMNARTNNHGIMLKGVEPSSLREVSAVFEHMDKGEVKYIDHPHLLFEKVRQRRARLYGLDDPPEEPDAGVEEEEENKFIPAPVNNKQRVLPAVIVGRELETSLRLYVGEEVKIISPLGDIGPTGPIPKSLPYRVGGVFFIGMYEFDSLYAYTSLEAAQKLLRKGDAISQIDIAVENPQKAQEIAAKISKIFNDRLRVKPWQEMNASLFSALKLEKIIMFIVLSFAIIVAAFCIIAILTMLVMEKGSEIAILVTLGATKTAIRRIFRFEGFVIGLTGTFCGLALGYGLCMALTHIGLPIPPEVWYIDKLPVNISPLEFVLVAVASMVITQVATIFPTWAASSINPVEGLKND